MPCGPRDGSVSSRDCEKAAHQSRLTPETAKPSWSVLSVRAFAAAMRLLLAPACARTV